MSWGGLEFINIGADLLGVCVCVCVVVVYCLWAHTQLVSFMTKVATKSKTSTSAVRTVTLAVNSQTAQTVCKSRIRAPRRTNTALPYLSNLQFDHACGGVHGVGALADS